MPLGKRFLFFNYITIYFELQISYKKKEWQMQLPDAYKLICHENDSILFEAIRFKAKHSRAIF